MNSPKNFLAAYEKALTSQNWSEVAPLIHKDCVFTFSDGTYSGKSAVEAAFRRTFTLIKEEQYRISNVHWLQKRATTAVLIYKFSWSGLIHGQYASGSGRGTSVLCSENGQWQLLCEHLGPEANS